MKSDLWCVALLCMSLYGGCQVRATIDSSPSLQPRQVQLPEQEPLLYDEYPEWAQRNWTHLVIILDSGSRRLGAAHYYIDPDSFDPEQRAYTTIENETIWLGNTVYQTDTKPIESREIVPYGANVVSRSSIAGHFEGSPGNHGWMFPCMQPGKWHMALGGTLGTTTDADDVRKCRQCKRYYEIGRIQFQQETGNVQVSRYF